RVLDRKVYEALLQSDLHRHFAFGGKFNRIAQNVDQNLPQTQRIRPNQRRYRVLGKLQKVDFLGVGFGLKRQLNILQNITDIHITKISFHFASLNLGQIQNVVDQGQKHLTVTLNQGQIVGTVSWLPLLFRHQLSKT